MLLLLDLHDHHSHISLYDCLFTIQAAHFATRYLLLSHHGKRNQKRKTKKRVFFSLSPSQNSLSFPDLFFFSSADRPRSARPFSASMLATRAALAAGANSAVPLASMIASLSANATTLAASQDATVMAILDDNDAYTLSQNLATLLDEAVETHSSAETAFVDAVAAAVDAKAAAVVAEATVEAAAAHIDVAATVDVTGTAAPPPTPPRPSSSKNIAYISAVAVAAAGALIVADAAISLFLGLGLHWQLVGGGLRCIGQLTVLGALLGPIFRSKAPPLVAAYAAFMLVVGSSEAASRPAYSYRGMAKHVVCSLGAASTAFLGYSLAVAVRPRPWWDPQYSIPTLGLMLGNAISGVAVGLGALLEDFAANGDRIELLLCLGASRWEATRGAVSRAVRLALTPLLNQLNVVGLVVRRFFCFFWF